MSIRLSIYLAYLSTYLSIHNFACLYICLVSHPLFNFSTSSIVFVSLSVLPCASLQIHVCSQFLLPLPVISILSFSSLLSSLTSDVSLAPRWHFHTSTITIRLSLSQNGLVYYDDGGDDHQRCFPWPITNWPTHKFTTTSFLPKQINIGLAIVIYLFLTCSLSSLTPRWVAVGRGKLFVDEFSKILCSQTYQDGCLS